jgi:hypothetical protein
MRRLLCSVGGVLCLFSVGIQAQTNSPTMPRTYSESHVTVMNLKNQYVWDVGVGNTVGYDVSKRVSVEGEINIFSADEMNNGGSKVEGLFQLKVGQKFSRFGLFAKLGPGVRTTTNGSASFSTAGFGCNGIPGSYSCFNAYTSTDFTGHVGGALEVYTTRRTFLRFNAGNTIIADSGSHHNFQTSSGFGFRF